MGSKTPQKSAPTQTRLSDYFKPKSSSSNNCISSSSTPSYFFTDSKQGLKRSSNSVDEDTQHLRKKRLDFSLALQKPTDLTLSSESILSSHLKELSFNSNSSSGKSLSSSNDLEGGVKKKVVATFTPLENQVLEFKKKYPGVILAIEVGYKYRFFGEDAKVAADHLNIVCWQDRNFLTASVPSFRIQVHIRRLVLDGFKVGLVQQVETAAIKSMKDSLEEQRYQNYIVIFSEQQGNTSMIAFDPSTGDLLYDHFPDSSLRNELNSRLEVLTPKEILLMGVTDIFETWILKFKNSKDVPIRVEKIDEFLGSNISQLLIDYFSFNSDTLKNIIELDLNLQSCVWALIVYLKQFGLDIAFELPLRLQHFSLYFNFHWSPSALVHLGVFHAADEPSLYSVLNYTNFPVSSRLLKTWLLRPLVFSDAILARQVAIQEILKQWDSFLPLSLTLRTLGDAEQLFMKIHYTRITPSTLYNFLGHWLDVIRALSVFEFSSPLLRLLYRDILACQNEVTSFFRTLKKDAAQMNDKIDLWQDQCLSDLKNELSKVCETLNEEASKEAKTVYGSVVHISGLEYLIEVPKTRSVPPTWIRVNSTTKVLRFHTPSLLEFLKRRDVIKETLNHQANLLYIQRLRAFSQSSFLPFSLAIRKTAELDCLWSLAKVAQLPDYTVPKLSDEQIIHIEDARHPVLETLKNYVPNSIKLSYNGPRTLLLSGLNMGGKSSFVRMVALQVLLTQIGSHVPSRFAEVGIFDGIYTRVGASDDMIRGRSTFLVEMMETSDILSRITPRSLVILDELGRGTSTYDGMAIAFAVLQYCLDFKPCLLLFITHYLPLSSIVEQHSSLVQCGHMGFLKEGKACTFLYKLVEGMAESSHGLNVARLAGIPEPVLSMAAKKSRESELKDLLRRSCHQLVQIFSRLSSVPPTNS